MTAPVAENSPAPATGAGPAKPIHAATTASKLFVNISVSLLINSAAYANTSNPDNTPGIVDAKHTYTCSQLFLDAY